ncbi:MAG: MFS transporter [Marinilabiliales bacterium]|nr:MAG: MFS transporter [Marinilabiliales bacterium]
MSEVFKKNFQYYKFCLYGFFKNLRFFEAFLLIFLLNNGLSYLDIGFLYTIREVVKAVMEIPSGFIADAFGRRKVLVSSFLFYIISFLIFGIFDSFLPFSIAMFFFAVGDAFRTGVHKAMIFAYLKRNNWEDQKVDYYGHTRSWSQAGSALSAAIGAIIVFYTDAYHTIFLMAIFPYLIDAVLIWSYPKYLDGETVKLKKEKIISAFKDVIKAFKLSIMKLELLEPLVSLSLYTGFYKSVKDYVQPILKMLALSTPVFAYLNDDKKTAVLIGIFYFITFLLTSVASKNSKRFNEIFKNASKAMNISILIGFLSGVIIGLSFIGEFYLASVIGFIFILIIENIRKPIGVSMLANKTEDDAMATILSVESQAKSIFAAILAPILGFLADKFTPGISLLVVSTLLILIEFGFILRQKKKQPQNK